MIRLSLLGAIDLRAEDGRELSAILKQPKRFGVLTYLAAADPFRLHRRDSLLALFWPELDASHARGALRRALYFLRREIGDAIVTRGDEVGASAQQLSCDVIDFRGAVDGGRLRDALDLYRGDLLEGFFVSSAPEFERWVEHERAELRWRAARAAWTMSERAAQAGDASEVVRWSQRAATLSPDDEGMVRSLIRLLDGVGARAQALGLFDVFAQRLADEFGTEPSSETRVVVQAIRDQREPSGRGTADGAVTPPVANVVAVLPFAVRGVASLRYLREGMVDLLSAKLDKAGDLRTVDPAALLRYVQSLAVDELDTELARSVATHFQAGLFLMGAILKVADHLHVSATLHDTASSRQVRADVEVAGEEQILTTVDTLVRRLLASWTTSLGGRMARLAAVTTDSLPALKAYLVGERAYRAGRFGDAVGAYERAVEEDPGFALGHYRLAATYEACGLPEAAQRPSGHAWTHRERLNVYTQLLVQAQGEWLRGAAPTAETLYTRVVGISPDDVEAWFRLGDLSFHYNPYRGRSVTEARAPLERALALDPKHVGALADLHKIAVLERWRDDADAHLARFLDLHGREQRALELTALHAFAFDEATMQREIISQLRALDPRSTVDILWKTLVYAGVSRKLVETFEGLGQRVASADLRAVLHLGLAHAALSHDDMDGAHRALDLVASVSPSVALVHRTWMMTLPFVAEDPERLSSAAKALDEIGQTGVSGNVERHPALATHEVLDDPLVGYLRGLVFLRQGNHRAAARCADLCEPVPNLTRGLRAWMAYYADAPDRSLRLLERLVPDRWFDRGLVSPISGIVGERYLRAEVLASLGRYQEMVGWFEGLGQRSPCELGCRAAGVKRLQELRDVAGTSF